MSRWRAAGLHLLLSAPVVVALCTLFLVFWYPGPLFMAAGAARLLATLLLLFLATGPLLTLLLYRKGKRGMRFDLWMIGVLQLASLLGGLYVAFQARPAYIALLPMRATLVRANELYPAAVPGRPAATAPLWGPRYVAVASPASDAEDQRLLAEIMEGLPDADYRPRYYRDLDQGMPALASELAPLADRIASLPPASARDYHLWLQRRGHSSTDGLRYLPLITPKDELDLVIDPRIPAVVGMRATH